MPKVAGGDITADMKAKAGKHIRSARKGKKLTQIQLAALLGVRNTTVCDWEKGRSYPGAEHLRGLAKHLGASSSFILSEPLARKGGIEERGRELASVIGQRATEALLEIPPAKLRREIAILVGRLATAEDETGTDSSR